jgi:release factor glutamine methyltransferase
MATVRELLVSGRDRLSASGSGGLDAEVLLTDILGVDRAWIYANGERAVSPDQAAEYRRRLERRHSGEPIAYLTGVREFWSLPLAVSPAVLIPRPETELLVEVALEHLPQDSRARVADLGTGCGAVALAIASERPSCAVFATDSSGEALAIARENGERLLPGRVWFRQGDWLEPLDGTFHVIVSNPPYVAAGDPHLQQGDCRFEPRSALTPGEDGLSAIRTIAATAIDFLEPGGLLAFEHGFDQGDAARRILEGLAYLKTETRRDLEGHDRVTLGFKGM